MSNWLGFSLTPHLRLDDDGVGNGFGRDEQNSHTGNNPPPPMSVMPLRPDGSLGVMNSLRPRSAAAPPGIYIYILIWSAPDGYYYFIARMQCDQLLSAFIYVDILFNFCRMAL